MSLNIFKLINLLNHIALAFNIFPAEKMEKLHDIKYAISETSWAVSWNLMKTSQKILITKV